MDSPFIGMDRFSGGSSGFEDVDGVEDGSEEDGSEEDGAELDGASEDGAEEDPVGSAVQPVNRERVSARGSRSARSFLLCLVIWITFLFECVDIPPLAMFIIK
jgi:hypothetical protein